MEGGGLGQQRELAWAGPRGIPAQESPLEAHVFRQAQPFTGLLLHPLSPASKIVRIYHQEPWGNVSLDHQMPSWYRPVTTGNYNGTPLGTSLLSTWHPRS